MAKKSLKDALMLTPKTAPLRKSKIDIAETEQAVKKIHKVEQPPKPREVAPPPQALPVASPKKKTVRTKRVTVDIPIPLHGSIKMKCFREGLTIKEYLLGLAERDLGV